MDGRSAIGGDFEGRPLRRVVVNIGERLIYVANPDLLQPAKHPQLGFRPMMYMPLMKQRFLGWNQSGTKKVRQPSGIYCNDFGSNDEAAH